MNIISASSQFGMMSAQRMSHHHKPDATQMASDLFSKLDTQNKGYVEKSDLTSALSQLKAQGTESTESSTADQLFTKLDGDGDGKITEDEMKSGLKQLADELDSQFNQMRMQGGMGKMGGMNGMPPPPPPENSQGSSQDQSSSQVTETGMKQIMDLMRAYGEQSRQAQNGFDTVSSLLSVTA